MGPSAVGDDDGLFDGAEPSPWEDTDEDGLINIRDTNSNDDNFDDDEQVWVVFRTNAVEGDYSGSGVSVGLIAPSANPYYPEVYDYQASVALYTWDSTVTSATGAGQIYNPYGPNGDERPPVPLTTPEGYAVLQKEEGSSVYDIYLQLGPTQYERFVKDSNAPGDWSESNRSQQAFLKNHQETYDGRVALDMDPDFDGISTIAEDLCNLNPDSNDTDSWTRCIAWGDGRSAGPRWLSSERGFISM
ncbi:MAG TPA: hypothetical protein VGB42_01660 [Candidatus Thermoplasmatota archaeon]